jgi:NTP pyrophosphatase (non-canonical NTP hydrolase)
MQFNEYQKFTATTAVYPGKGETMGLVYAIMGAGGEGGELLNKMKKVLRDDNGVVSEEVKKKLADETSDMCWYIAQIFTELGISFEDAIQANIQKLTSRLERGVIQGSGDNR